LRKLDAESVREPEQSEAPSTEAKRCEDDAFREEKAGRKRAAGRGKTGAKAKETLAAEEFAASTRNRRG
jgi:hypothetical protein